MKFNEKQASDDFEFEKKQMIRGLIAKRDIAKNLEKKMEEERLSEILINAIMRFLTCMFLSILAIHFLIKYIWS